MGAVVVGAAVGDVGATVGETVGTAVVGAAVGEVGDMVGATDGAGAEQQIVHPVRDTE